MAAEIRADWQQLQPQNKHGCPTPSTQQLLQTAAVAGARGDDIAGCGYIVHEAPDGMGLSDRITRADYRSWNGSHYGISENTTIETTLGDLD